MGATAASAATCCCMDDVPRSLVQEAKTQDDHSRTGGGRPDYSLEFSVGAGHRQRFPEVREILPAGAFGGRGRGLGLDRLHLGRGDGCPARIGGYPLVGVSAGLLLFRSLGGERRRSLAVDGGRGL